MTVSDACTVHDHWRPPMATVPLDRGRRYREAWGWPWISRTRFCKDLRIPEAEIAQRLRTELAIALYAQGALSLGKAAELAEMNRMAFGQVAGQRGIARHYGDADLAQDVSYARSE